MGDTGPFCKSHRDVLNLNGARAHVCVCVPPQLDASIRYTY
jgi:hypothetical protein